MKAFRVFVCAAGAFFIATKSTSQQLIYTPVSPTFGGSPFNSAHVLGVAGANNDTKDPNAPKPLPPRTPQDMFASQLQSMLLSGLASQVTEAIFGDNPQQHGVITFGPQTITFDRTLENVQLVISDSSTGQSTNISIPLLATTS